MPHYIIEYEQGRPTPVGLVDCATLFIDTPDLDSIEEAMTYADELDAHYIAGGSRRVLDADLNELARETINDDRTTWQWEDE